MGTHLNILCTEVYSAIWGDSVVVGLLGYELLVNFEV